MHDQYHTDEGRCYITETDKTKSICSDISILSTHKH